MGASVKSARRVLELFEYFAQRRRPATLTQISTALGYPPSSTSALLETLRDAGYLDHARKARTFVPTVRASLLGLWVHEALVRGGSIISLMDTLSRETGGAAVLAVQKGHHAEYIHVAKAFRDGHRTQVTTGAHRPLLRSAVGDVILAIKTNSELRALVARINARECPAHQVGLPEVAQRLEDVRQRGYAWRDGMATPGYGIIAMLLAAPSHHPAMALGLGARSDALHAHRDQLLVCLHKVVHQHRAAMEALPQAFSCAG